MVDSLSLGAVSCLDVVLLFSPWTLLPGALLSTFTLLPFREGLSGGAAEARSRGSEATQGGREGLGQGERAEEDRREGGADAGGLEEGEERFGSFVPVRKRSGRTVV